MGPPGVPHVRNGSRASAKWLHKTQSTLAKYSFLLQKGAMGLFLTHSSEAELALLPASQRGQSAKPA